MSTGRQERAALVALAALPAIGPATLLALQERGDAEHAWSLVHRGRGDQHPMIAAAVAGRPGHLGLAEVHAAAAPIDAGAFLDRHRQLGIEVLVRGDAAYPDRLDDDPAPPALLFVDGSLAGLEGRSVAIVGTRNATRLGCDTAASLAEELSSTDIAIVSGLALGIDGAAHRAVVDAFDRGRRTAPPVAVVAAGLDRRYPRRHARLHQQVAHRGAVISEVPIGVAPTRWRFPARNRIIAGLADALVVVESRSAGGSMLTVGEALARDVPVLAVPGHPTSPASAGTLDLICDGAVPVRDAEDVRVAVGAGGVAPAERGVDRSDEGDDGVDDARARTVLDALGAGPASLSELVRATGWTLASVSEVVLALELRGRIVRSGSWYEPRARGANGAGR
ncbi:MAG: DNA-processing protein DprA [Acidimicrobiales bacterium]|nr:DNA-processing protein DprA [Acidimicrobiales bacterium]HRW37345.1 DNA-processing protein DprA [Aquihabitans sp.]